MKYISDVIRDRLFKSLIGKLPKEEYIPYKPHPGSYISLRTYLAERHTLLNMRNAINGKAYTEIIKQPI